MSVEQICTIEAFPALWTSIIPLILMRLEMTAEVVLPLVCPAAQIAAVAAPGFLLRARSRRVLVINAEASRRHPSMQPCQPGCHPRLDAIQHGGPVILVTSPLPPAEEWSESDIVLKSVLMLFVEVTAWGGESGRQCTARISDAKTFSTSHVFTNAEEFLENLKLTSSTE